MKFFRSFPHYTIMLKNTVFPKWAVLLFVIQITLMLNTPGVGVPPSRTFILDRPLHLLTPFTDDHSQPPGLPVEQQRQSSLRHSIFLRGSELASVLTSYSRVPISYQFQVTYQWSLTRSGVKIESLGFTKVAIFTFLQIFMIFILFDTYKMLIIYYISVMAQKYHLSPSVS